MTGAGFTTTVTRPVELAAAFVAMSVYVVVTAGETTRVVCALTSAPSSRSPVKFCTLHESVEDAGVKIAGGVALNETMVGGRSL